MLNLKEKISLNTLKTLDETATAKYNELWKEIKSTD